ncbi:hypothetical protein DERP_010044, partial [Dermatophagoides pteronyssinus]
HKIESKYSLNTGEIIRPNFFEIPDNQSDNKLINKYLLTFNTKLQVFYAVLNKINHTNPNVECDFYQGRIISPVSNGFIAATICMDNFNQSILYSTIILNDETFVIRSSIDKQIFVKRSINLNDFNITTKNDNKVCCSSFESQSIQQQQDGWKMKKFDSHYLYRFSIDTDKSWNIVKKADPEKLIDLIDQATTTITKRDIHSDINEDQGKNLPDKIYNIETIIFVDQTLIRNFNGARKELEKLILAIMNEVQLIYNFDTMKTRIRIVIKKIVYLDDKKTDIPNTADGDIDQYLDNFCAWQKRLLKRTEINSRWDHALMLTGLDLYKKIGKEKNRKVLGLAWVNGMCRPSYSCTLNEGKNFESAFVIAHEMAHSLGMLHDGYDNNCDPDKYIMSEKTGPGKIHWSPCSNLYLENFLTKSNLKCLEKTSEESFFTYTSPLDDYLDQRLPGEQYNINQQCQLALGNQYQSYISKRSPFNDICKELWCSHGHWASPAHPALEGSPCGDGKICSQGSCTVVAMTKTNNRSISYLNRHRQQPNDHHPDNTKQNKENSRTNSSQSPSSFMKRVQRFLKSTIRSVVRFFSG